MTQTDFKGYVRPLRDTYMHVGSPNPANPLLDLTEEQQAEFPGYVKWEAYPESDSPISGKFWTQEEIDKIGNGCELVTLLNDAIAETFAQRPAYYSETYCAGCHVALPVNEFVWVVDGVQTTDRVGN